MHRISYRALSLMAVFALLLLAGSAVAQVTTGILVGVISDQTGAVIAGATVTAKNKATGVERTSTSNQNGEFEIGPLQPGDYEVTVEASGFTKTVQQSATVNVGSRSSLNFSLKPSGTEDIVTISGEAGATIETTNTVVQGVVDNKQLAELPLSGRTFANVAILIPGAKPVGAFDPTKSRTGTISIAGSTGRDANVSVDGGDNKDNVVGGALQNYTTEGIQEFVVQTQNFLPDTGRSAGGAITVVTKSGTNEYHGSFVFFERNDRTNRRAFNNQEFDPITGDGPNDKQAFDRQNIAGSFGGPIIKDKFFFFGAIEYTRENVSIVIDPAAVSELRALDVFARAGQIPGISTVAALPTVSTPFRDTQFQIRSDLKWSDKQLMTFRYGHQSNDLDNDQVGNNDDVTAGATTTNELRSALFSDTYTLSNSIVNVFTFQFNKFINRINAKSDAVGLLFPSVNFGRDGNVPQSTLQNKFQFREALSVIKGRHSLKFGIDYVWTPILGGTFDFNSTPEFFFNEDPSSILARGGKLSEIDIVDLVTVANGNSRNDQSIDQISFYGQDSFRVNRKFTLNYGVRYDADLNFYDSKNGATQLNNRGVILLQKIGFLAPGEDGAPEDDKNNFSPRIGFAFDPKGDGKAVIRASYGLYFDQIFQNVQFFALQQANPNIYAQLILDPIRLGIDPLPSNPGILKELPAGARARLLDPALVTPYSQQSSINFQYEFAPGYVFETQYIHILGLNEFVGLEPNARIGAANPNFVIGTPTSQNPRALASRFAAAGIRNAPARVSIAASLSRSRYDGFSIGVQKRYAGSGSFKTQFGANYTLSRTLAYGGPTFASRNDFGNTFENPFEQFRPIDLGRTGEDARHRFVFNGLVDLPGAFQVSTILQAESSRPFPVFISQDLNGDGRAVDFARVDGNGNFIRFRPGQTASIGRSLGVTPGRGVPYFQVDLRVTKKIKIGERVKVEGYVEFFNLFDRANVGNTFGDGGLADVNSSIRTGKNTPPRDPLNVKDFLPSGLLGSSFGAGTTIGVPLQAQFGFRVSF
jgi:hypothetical protein